MRGVWFLLALGVALTAPGLALAQETTTYTYDVHGRVTEALQEDDALIDPEDG